MINCIGQMFDNSGYAHHFRYLANALNKLTKVKISTNLHPGWETQVNDAELEMIKREEDYETNLVITHPLNWRSNLNAKRNFVYLIWEGDKIPVWMLQECMNDKIEKIIVPSNHTKTAALNSINTNHKYYLKTQPDSCKEATIMKKLNNKLVVIPHGHDPKVFYPIVSDKKDENTPNSHLETRSKPEEANTDDKTGDVDNHADTFKFLANKGLRNLEDRGGLQYLIKAYIEEFTESDNVELILKVNIAYGIQDYSKMFPNLKKKGIPKVTFITENYTTKQLNELYNECDVFVSPTRAESFNLPVLEAMACGKPVITTSFGGQTDFCTNFTGRIFSGVLTEVKHEIEYEGIKWLTPDHNLLKDCLRYMYENKPDYRDKCLETAKSLTWDICANKIFNLTAKFIN